VDEHEAALTVALARGVGPATAAKLVKNFGSYRRAVAAATGKAEGGGAIPPAVRRAIAESAGGAYLARQLERTRADGARFTIDIDPEYPRVLTEIANAPVGLFVRGASLAKLGPMLAVVGTRAPTPRGRAVAFELAADLARAGVTVVSGLARGIDTEAHEGCLEAGGPTVAVLGSGLDRTYPPENGPLARRIAASGGAVVSEFAMGREAFAGHFPRRNRIVAGLTMGVVVVEAAARSGALITAARALEQGREVFAVPGPIDEPQSRGPNGLIKAGAKLVEDVGDVLDELEAAWGPFGPRGAQQQQPSSEAAQSGPAAGGELARAIRGRLTLTPVSPDELAANLRTPVREILAALATLELAGAARACPGGRFVAGDRKALATAGAGRGTCAGAVERAAPRAKGTDDA